MENQIALRIKEVRNQNQLNQNEFAKSLGITQAGISYIEKGEGGVSIDVLQKISDAYNVTIDWLVKGEGHGIITKKFIEQRIDDLEQLTHALSDQIKSLLSRINIAEPEWRGIKAKSEYKEKTKKPK